MFCTPIRAAALVITLIFLLSGCCIEGSGEMEQKEVYVAPFSKISIDIPAVVHVRSSDGPNMSIHTDSNILPHIRATVSDDTLQLTLAPGDCCIDPTVLNVYVGADTLRHIHLEGAGQVIVKDAFQSDTFEASVDGDGTVEMTDSIEANEARFSIDGSGAISATVVANEILSEIDGTGILTLSGDADVHTLSLDGAATVHAFDLLTAQTFIAVDGSANCEVTADEQLHVLIDGAATVQYQGDALVTQEIDGIGSVEQIANESP